MRTTGILRWGGILLGLGLGGFADGIVLHQILQWHHMLSSVVPPVDMEAMRVNMRADGFFHLATWITTVLGVWMLWQAGQRVTAFPSARWFIGQFFIGWGIFNFVEGLIDPQVVSTVTSWCAQQGVLAEELTVAKRSLEDVFLELTGRELRS